MGTRVLSVVLLVDALVIGLSGLADLLVYGSDRLLMGLLALVTGAVNAIAYWDLRQWDRHRTEAAVTRNGSWVRSSVVVGQATAVPLLTYPLYTELTSEAHGLLDVLVASVAAALLLSSALVLALAASARPNMSIAKSWIAILALLPLAGSVEFWYSSIHAPAQQRPNINIVADLQEVGQEVDYADATAV